MKPSVVTNEKGIVLVLAIFMLALLSMIGIAAMMTGTTEIEIAGNEKFHQTAFYEAETGLTIASEVVEVLGGYDEVADCSFLDDNETIRVVDGQFLFEPKDVPASTGEWDKDNQTDDAAVPLAVRQQDCDDRSLNDIEAYHDIEMGGMFSADVDVDKVKVSPFVGGGTEFAAGAEGIGVKSFRVIYNIDSVGKLAGRSTVNAEHVWGFQFIPRF